MYIVMNVYIQDAVPMIILLGDIMLDHNIQGTSAKIANEAPIPVIHDVKENYRIGGCGNVLNNLLALGTKTVFLFSKVGADVHGEQLLSLLPNQTVNYVTVDPDSITTTKHRVYSDKKLMCRYDTERYTETTHKQEAVILGNIATLLETQQITSVVFSDYKKGFLTKSLCQCVIALCCQKGVPTIVDPKHNYYESCTVIKPNRMELQHIFGIDLKALSSIEEGHRLLHEKLGCTASVITLSEDGISAYSKKEHHRYKEDVKEIIDVTGAGDVVCSVLGAYYPFIKDMDLLIKIASHLASISISHIGVYTITPHDLLHTYRAIHHSKQLLMPQMLRRGIASCGSPIVFTNGCFDILHSAHLELFQFCKKLGGIVVVGLNSDDSIRRLKGPTRPIFNLADRIKLLEALEYIDFIIPFEEDTPLELLKQIRPRYLVKGGDYTKETIVGGEYAEEVVLFSYVAGKSTTNTIQTIRHKDANAV